MMAYHCAIMTVLSASSEAPQLEKISDVESIRPGGNSTFVYIDRSYGSQLAEIRRECSRAIFSRSSTETSKNYNSEEKAFIKFHISKRSISSRMAIACDN